MAASLARKRAQERIVREREIFLKEEFNATCVAKWEQRTSMRIERQDLINRAKRMTEQDSQYLQLRQSKIKQLYETELSRWKKEIEERNYVSIEDRIDAIREKANRLREKREKEKKEFVNDCYNRRWREGCDDVRALTAKAVTEKLMIDREQSLGARKSDCDDFRDDEKDQLILALEKKENEEELERQRTNREIKLALDEQVKINKSKRANNTEARQREEAEQLARWSLENKLEKENKLEILRNARKQGELTLESNIERLKDRQRNTSQKFQEEKMLLDFAVEKEKMEIRMEEEHKQRHQGAAGEYREFFKDQMAKDQMAKDDTKNMREIKKMRDEAMENTWTSRDEELKAKIDARNKLTAEVNASRDEQIFEKNRRAEEMRRTETIEVESNMKLWHQERQSEKDKKERKKQQTVQNMLWNKKIVDNKRQKETLEKQETFLIQKQMARAEQEYAERVQREAGRAETYFPRRGSDLFLH